MAVKLKLLIKEVDDVYTQENFLKIQRFLDNNLTGGSSGDTNTTIVTGGDLEPTFSETIESAVSFKPTYSGDLITNAEYFDSLTQVNANRTCQSVFTYNSDDLVATQVNTIYEADGITPSSIDTLTYTYSGDVLTKVEVS